MEKDVNGPFVRTMPTLTPSSQRQASLLALLQQSNGFWAAGHAVLFLPSGKAVPGLPTLEEFNDPKGWVSKYAGDVGKALFFALDALGQPFGILDDKIVLLDPEAGSLKDIAPGFAKFMEDIESDSVLSGADVIQGWLDSGRDFDPTKRLMPMPPIIAGGTTDPAGLVLVEVLERAEATASIHEQIKDIPDGQPIRFKVSP